MLSTPINLIESYFDVELDRRGLKHLRGIPDGGWIDFAKQYWATMNESFVKDFLEVPNNASASLPLYFEPILRESWDYTVQQLYNCHTPLLGMQPDPKVEISPAAVSQMLQPLKKHLLVADSVYIRDSFYYCFRGLAEWRDPGLSFNVPRLKAWLPLLMELRPLIDSRALVFMPDWLTPSFSHFNSYNIDQMNALKLGMHPSPHDLDTPDRPPLKFDFEKAFSTKYEPPIWKPNSGPGGGPDEFVVITTWLNARLMGLNPVFPDQDMYDYSLRLYFRGDDDGDQSFSLTSDLMSFDILPLGRRKPVSIKELMSLRKNEEGFAAVRSAVEACQQRLKNGLTSQATRKDAQALCRDVMDEYQAEYGGKARQVVNFLNQNVIASTVLSLAVGATMIPTAGISAAIGVLAPAFLSPAIANIMVNRRNPASRALTQLQAIL